MCRKEERRIQILVETPEVCGTFGKSRHRWEDNIKMDLQKVGCGGMVWTGSSWIRIGTGAALVDTVIYLRI
jgi:3-oxoacyl-ACP reductase-like protein